MKLSEFDLGWYGQWGIAHEPLDEWSRPGLTNSLGSLQATGDPTSLRHVMFPPVSGSEDSTCYLTINGTFLNATRIETQVRWMPWRVERSARYDEWGIESRLCMVNDRQAAVQAVTVTNHASQARSLDMGFRLSGRCVNRGVDKWYWMVPSISLGVHDLLEHSGLDPLIHKLEGMGIMYQERPLEGEKKHPFAGKAFHAQGFSPSPTQWKRNGDAGFCFELPAGESQTLYYALAMDESAVAADVLREVLAEPEKHFEEAERMWRDLWKSAFEEGGDLSGALPDLDLPESVLPVASSGVLSALQSRRTHRATGGRSFYNISTPRRVEACYYPNDWAMASRTLAWLDPEATWRQWEMALKADVRKYNQINFLTGKGGDGQGEGWPYTVDIYNMFYAGWFLWQQSGGAPEMLTDKTIDTAKGKMTMLEVLEDFALDWRSRRVEAYGLADYGPKEELLECVSTYEHIVASVNAAAVWMLRRLVEIYQLLGRGEGAEAISREADGLRDAILQHLYVEDCGWFACMDASGRKREVRHCWDTGMVLMCMGTELPENVQREIVHFFKTELQTPGWIRALSPHDGDAAVSGVRADHQFNGAFGSWPAEVALGLIRIGEKKLAQEWMEGIARTARQGPFAQAYYDEGVFPSTLEGATKVTEELPQCCHWSNISGAMFFSVMEELFDR